MKKTCFVAGLWLLGSQAALAQQAPEAAKPPLGFFVTSTGLGKGADLGGLAGADAHCQRKRPALPYRRQVAAMI